MKKKLVGMFATKAEWKVGDAKPIDCKIIYDLFETVDGDRSYSVRCSVLDDGKEMSKEGLMAVGIKFRIYQDMIIPWLNGMYDPRIETYSTMAELELASRISGEPPLTLIDYDELEKNRKAKKQVS